MKNKVKIKYVDFWPGFDSESDFFTKLLRQKWDVELSDKPDFIIYSVFGFEHLKYNCIRIFYTGENTRPDYRICDYSFSFDYNEKYENYRLPYYARRIYGVDLSPYLGSSDQILAKKTDFCSFVYSDPKGKVRNRFLSKLSKYKEVNSGGRFKNNIGAPVKDKLDFLSHHKFDIAFEHSSFPGYTTEKITDAFMAHSLPIYWGNNLIERDFNTQSFLNYHSFHDEDELIERIIELDRDDEKYLAYLSSSRFPDDSKNTNEFIDPGNILAHFDRIFSKQKVPIAIERKKMRWMDGTVAPFLRRVGNKLDFK